VSAAYKMMFRVPEAVVRTAVARPLGKNAYEPLKLVARASDPPSFRIQHTAELAGAVGADFRDQSKLVIVAATG